MNTKTVNILSALALVSTVIYAAPGVGQEQGATAENQQQTEQNSNQEIGTTTRRLLDLQRQGVQASQNRQYISGAEMQRIYQRYLETFEHPVPEFFVESGFSAE